MNEIITKENIKIEDMIFEVRGKQVMLDSLYATKCNYDLYDKIMTHYDTGKPISMFNNFFRR